MIDIVAIIYAMMVLGVAMYCGNPKDPQPMTTIALAIFFILSPLMCTEYVIISSIAYRQEKEWQMTRGRLR